MIVFGLWCVGQQKQDITYNFSNQLQTKHYSRKQSADELIMNIIISYSPSFYCAVPLINVTQRITALPNVFLQHCHPLKCKKEHILHIYRT